MTTLLLLLAVATLGACAAPVSQDVAANDNRTPAGMLRDGVLTLNLSVRIGQWQPEGPSGPSLGVPVFAEADRAPEAPGPLIRVPTGTRLAVLVRNELKIAVDVHGLHDRPGHSSDVVTLAPGSSRKLEFSAGPPGTYYYWATIAGLALDERNGYDGQLTGAFIVDAPGADPGRADDRVFVIGHWSEEGDPKPQAELMDSEAWVLNGRSWPATERLSYPVNRPIRWRIINASYEGHPMHLHGNYFQVNASGDESSTTAFAETDRPLVATNVIPSGQTIAIAWTPQRPGNWLFHCHILYHVDPLLHLSQAPASGGLNHMAGLVLGIVVRPDPAAPAAVTAANPRALTLQVGERPGVLFGASMDSHGERWPGLGYRLAADRGDAPAPYTAPGPPLVLTRSEPVAITVENQ